MPFVAPKASLPLYRLQTRACAPAEGESTIIKACSTAHKYEPHELQTTDHGDSWEQSVLGALLGNCGMGK